MSKLSQFNNFLYKNSYAKIFHGITENKVQNYNIQNNQIYASMSYSKELSRKNIYSSI